MNIYYLPQKEDQSLLALGAESDGNFCFFTQNKIYFSENFGDLLEEKNWQKFQETVSEFLKKNKFKPDIIITDLHPLYLTSVWGEELSKIYKAKHIQVQHHFAHIFSAIGERIMHDTLYIIPNTFYGIATDGTGYGEDGKIWGGEVFAISNFQFPISKKFPNSNDKISKQKLCIKRIGHLENQTLIGGDLAIREPARMLISILDKAISPSPSGKEWRGAPGEGKGELQRKNYIYRLIKKYYTKNEFELIYSQLKQNFNCLETSSTGRILDAVSILLGFCGNERKYKHEPIALLEANSGKPYADIKPKIISAESGQISNFKFQISNQLPMTKFQNNLQILDTTFLFEYLVKNLHKDKKRLAATAQLYIAQGLCEIIKNSCHPERSPEYSRDEVEGSARKYHQQYSPEDSSTPLRCAQNDIFFSGGIANNKIISEYLISKGAYASKKIYPVKLPNGTIFNGVPRGDAGLSFGQIAYYLLSK
jgi:hydrogenase maturation protein HypF